jgi:hypothetical protein
MIGTERYRKAWSEYDGILTGGPGFDPRTEEGSFNHSAAYNPLMQRTADHLLPANAQIKIDESPLNAIPNGVMFNVLMPGTLLTAFYLSRENYRNR